VVVSLSSLISVVVDFASFDLISSFKSSDDFLISEFSFNWRVFILGRVSFPKSTLSCKLFLACKVFISMVKGLCLLSVLEFL